MALQRRLPDSDIKRYRALLIAKLKKDNTPPANIVLTPPTIAKLDLVQPQLSQRTGEKDIALAAQCECTTEKNTAQKKLKKNIAHFITAFNNGVERGIFPKEHRAFYHLDIESNRVPKLGKESEITFRGGVLIAGDAARIAAGGVPMANPSIAEVQADYNNFVNLNVEQSTLKDAYDKAQEAVSGMRGEVKMLILKIWDEVETAFDDEPIESRRRKARQWGVVYVGKRLSRISGEASDAATGKALQGVSVELVEMEEIVKTNSEGKYKLKIHYVGEGTLKFSLAGYATQTFSIHITEGETLEQDAKLVAV